MKWPWDWERPERPRPPDYGYDPWLAYADGRVKDAKSQQFLPGFQPLVQDTDGWYAEVLTAKNDAGHVIVRLTDYGTDPYKDLCHKIGDVFLCHASHLRIVGFK